MPAQSSSIIERREGTAVWKQIEQVLMRQIWEGQISPGDRLPSEAALAEKFGVNRHTIRRTLSEMATRNVVRIENGRGAFVRDDVLNYRLAVSSRFWETLLRDGQSPSVTLIAGGEQPASRTVAGALDLREGEATVFLDALGRANGDPVVLARHSFPARLFPDLVGRYKAEGSIQAALQSYGVSTRRHRVRVSACLPQEDEIAAFGQPWPQPILKVESIYIDDKDRPVDFGVARYASGRVQLDIEF